MKNTSKISNFLLTNPFKRGLFEWFILISTGILGTILSWDSFSIFPYTNILGGILILLAFIFHGRAEKDHKQAHKKTDKIKKVVTSGVYSKIRHPLYISIIISNIGIALAFGVLITLLIVPLTVIHWVATSFKEEQMLQLKFRDEYAQYKESVPWRMIPGIF